MLSKKVTKSKIGSKGFNITNFFFFFFPHIKLDTDSVDADTDPTDATDLANSADSTDSANLADSTNLADLADLADSLFNPHLDRLVYF